VNQPFRINPSPDKVIAHLKERFALQLADAHEETATNYAAMQDIFQAYQETSQELQRVQAELAELKAKYEPESVPDSPPLPSQAEPVVLDAKEMEDLPGEAVEDPLSA
jgi:hypothetical protein